MAWDVPSFYIPVNPNQGGQIASYADRLLGAYDQGQASRRQRDVFDARRSVGGAGMTNPDGSPNYQSMAERLLGAGDIEGANTFMRLGQQQEDRSYRRSRDASEDTWRQQQFGFQQQQAAAQNARADKGLTLQEQQIARAGVPAGYQPTPEGGVAPMPGGPQDPDAMKRERVRLATEAGLVAGSPAWKAYILTGKLPREDAQPLSAADKKAILEADDAVADNRAAIANLDRAQQLSPQALSGAVAGARSWLGNNLPDWAVPDFIASPQQAQATSELSNTVTANALQQLKAIFGGAPTEGERAILLQIQGAADQPRDVREAIYRRAAEMAQRRLDFNKQRADALRGGTYYQQDPNSTAANPTAAPTPAPSGGKNADRAPGGAPVVGQVENGYRYKGGNPADPNSWEQVQ